MSARFMIACLAFALPLATSASAADGPRILLTNDGAIDTCYVPGPCGEMTADFSTGWVNIAMTLNEVIEVSEVRFGIEMPVGDLTYHECVGSLDIGTVNGVRGIIWHPEEPCLQVSSPFVRMGNIRVGVFFPGTVSVVEHPSFLAITVVDCEGKHIEIPPENWGVAGVGMPSYLPCTDAVPVAERTWAQVKAIFDDD